MGRHTKHGGYVIEWNKVRTYVVPPELKSFKVRYRLYQPGLQLLYRWKGVVEEQTGHEQLLTYLPNPMMRLIVKLYSLRLS